MTDTHTTAMKRLVELFDNDDTAASFMVESGEGGLSGAVYRMAREIERLKSHTTAHISDDLVFKLSQDFIMPPDEVKEILTAAFPYLSVPCAVEVKKLVSEFLFVYNALANHPYLLVCKKVVAHNDHKLRGFIKNTGVSERLNKL